jgi:hypothetical protein
MEKVTISPQELVPGYKLWAKRQRFAAQIVRHAFVGQKHRFFQPQGNPERAVAVGCTTLWTQRPPFGTIALLLL